MLLKQGTLVLIFKFFIGSVSFQVCF